MVSLRSTRATQYGLCVSVPFSKLWIILKVYRDVTDPKYGAKGDGVTDVSTSARCKLELTASYAYRTRMLSTARYQMGRGAETRPASQVP
jgi:hypothetical protein